MATLTATNPTLLDLMTAMGPDDKIAAIVEVLAQSNEILDDMTWVEGNLVTGHQTTVRTGIPTPTWRRMYGGVQPSKGTQAKITDTTGMLENYAEIDKALADLNGNTNAFRLGESRAIIEGFNQVVSQTLFYGNEGTTPEAFTGLAPRFNSLGAANGTNIIDAGGTGADNCSIWLVGWGTDTCHGIVPKGSQVGLQMNDKGQVTIENVDGSGGRMEAYRTHFRWDLGLTVRDWRYIVRIANIDVSDLVKTAATGADLIDLMTQALEQIQSLSGVRPAFYTTRSIKAMLRRQQVSKVAQSTLTTETLAGKPVLTFDGVPVRRVDQLVSNEARVV